MFFTIQLIIQANETISATDARSQRTSLGNLRPVRASEVNHGLTFGFIADDRDCLASNDGIKGIIRQSFSVESVGLL